MSAVLVLEDTDMTEVVAGGPAIRAMNGTAFGMQDGSDESV